MRFVSDFSKSGKFLVFVGTQQRQMLMQCLYMILCTESGLLKWSAIMCYRRLYKLHCVGSALPVQQTRVVQNLEKWYRQMSGSTLFYLQDKHIGNGVYKRTWLYIHLDSIISNQDQEYTRQLRTAQQIIKIENLLSATPEQFHYQYITYSKIS